MWIHPFSPPTCIYIYCEGDTHMCGYINFSSLTGGIYIYYEPIDTVKETHTYKDIPILLLSPVEYISGFTLYLYIL